jgi:N-acetyl-gamma-glutamyl-phosphate reductase
MKKTIFIDGQHGTTGLKIQERLKTRTDISLVEIPIEKKKDIAEKKKYLNESDIVFLCLPDDAARESVAMISNPSVCVIDGSTAHRTAEGWVYGLPELCKTQRDLIRSSNRICVPGCHATGFVLLLYPLIASGIVSRDYPISAFSISGYSGGGRSMIAQYQVPDLSDDMKNPRPYALKLSHKHVPEMQKIPGLSFPPVFFPTVANFYNGEVISIPFFKRLLNKKMTAKELSTFYQEYYQGEQFVKIMPYPTDAVVNNGFLTLTQCNETNRVELFVFGDEEKMVLTARFDNLGKGSSGAAVQNMNIKIGAKEESGL